MFLTALIGRLITIISGLKHRLLVVFLVLLPLGIHVCEFVAVRMHAAFQLIDHCQLNAVFTLRSLTAIDYQVVLINRFHS